LVSPSGNYFFVDTQISVDPDAEEIVEMTLLAAEEVARFGVAPRVALVSHSSFGSSPEPSAAKMRSARELLAERAPDLPVEGEMQADAAVSQAVRDAAFPDSAFPGPANLLVMPNRDAANIAFNLLKSLGGGVSLGPMLLGNRKPGHILTASATTRAVVNISALLAVEAQTAESGVA
ncbi:MAG: phosphate acyltransferase, partial [Pseudomonadota bacterium]